MLALVENKTSDSRGMHVKYLRGVLCDPCRASRSLLFRFCCGFTDLAPFLGGISTVAIVDSGPLR